jgi:hypothetical protein
LTRAIRPRQSGSWSGDSGTSRRSSEARSLAARTMSIAGWRRASK